MVTRQGRTTPYIEQTKTGLPGALVAPGLAGWTYGRRGVAVRATLSNGPAAAPGANSFEFCGHHPASCRYGLLWYSCFQVESVYTRVPSSLNSNAKL
jgi:hypothetical protein